MYTDAPDTPLFDTFTGPWGVSQPHVQYREGRRCLACHFLRKGRGPQIYLWEGGLRGPPVPHRPSKKSEVSGEVPISILS